MRVVSVENGYLRLENKRAEELFEYMVERGILWDHLSSMFNQAALEEGMETEQLARLNEDMVNVKATIEAVARMMLQVDKKLNALPPPRQFEAKDIVVDRENDPNIVEATITEVSTVKPKGGKGLLSKAANQFSKMAGGGK